MFGGTQWMEKMCLDKPGFKRLQKTLGMSRNRSRLHEDPSVRLNVAMEYLVTGVGCDCCIDEEYEHIFDEISRGLHKYRVEWPETPEKWAANASAFQQKWGLENCLGAIVSNKVSVVPQKEDQDMRAFWNPAESDEPFFVYYDAVDADCKVIFSGVGFPGAAVNEPMQILHNRRSQFQARKPNDDDGGDADADPYTFVGTNELGSWSWLRTPKSGKKKSEKQRISKALRPAEIVQQLLVSRFAVLATTVHVPHSQFIGRLIRVIHTLHNYFMQNNPKYSEGLVDYQGQPLGQGKPPAAVLKKTQPAKGVVVAVPKYRINVDQPWMEKIHMDEQVFGKLLTELSGYMQKLAGTRRPEVVLRSTLKYMVTGEREDACDIWTMRYGLSTNYNKELPYAPREWEEVARQFEQRHQLPNCIGVFVALQCSAVKSPFAQMGMQMPEEFMKLFGFGSNSVSVHAMIASWNGYILYSCPCTADYGPEMIAESVTCAMEQELGVPAAATSGKKGKYQFIGDRDMGSHRLLATAKKPRHFTQEQVKRGVALSQKIVSVWRERFGCMAQLFDKDPTDGNMHMHSINRLHNFLLVNSDTYGEVFCPGGEEEEV